MKNENSNIRIIAILITLFITNSLFSQKLTEIISNPDLNYFQIQEQIRNSKSLFDNTDVRVSKRYFRWQTFWNTRIDENGDFNTYGNNIQKYNDKYVSSSKSANNLWESLGPNINNLVEDYKHIGRISSIWVNPNDTSEILLGTSNAGLWRSMNGGDEWIRITNNMSFGVHSIQVDMENNIIYIATYIYANGLLRHGYYGHGIMKSIDNGVSWETIYNDASGRAGISELLLSKINGKLYAVSGDDFIQSNDQGETWQTTNIGSDIDIRNIAQNPLNLNQFVLSGRRFLYITNDEGENWISKKDCVTFDAWFAADYSQEGTLWVNVCRDEEDYADNSDLLKSYDNGQTWETPTFTYTDFGGTTGAVVVLNAFTDDCIYTGGGSLDKITNNGTIRDDATYYHGKNTHADIRDIYFPDPTNPDLTYIVTDGGVNKTTTGGVNNSNTGTVDEEWQRIYGNLALNECYAIAISEQNPELMLMGTIDNGSYMRSEDGTWDHVYGGDGGESLIIAHLMTV